MSARVAIVTGASRGIGRATAIRLAQDFDAITLVARTPETLDSASAEVRTAGAEALVLPRDLRDGAACQDVVSATLDRFGRIDALVCIAGAVPQGDLFTLSEGQWSDGLALKFHSARQLTIAAWPALRVSGGSVVITSGTSALTPKASLAAVGTINAAIIALAKAFAERGVEEGVQVNSILPGPVMTDRRRAMLQNYADQRGLTLDDAITLFADEAGIARYGMPEDIAHTIAFLVAPQTRWLTGTAIRVDGGEISAI